MGMKRILLSAAILLLANGLVWGVGPDPAPAGAPVVVELFTSEGCSSCPPADALLMDLNLHQPVAGVEVIALGEHVDYWNDLGWKDRFSSAQYSQRQSRYAARFGLESVYTPQMVINGREEFVGNDRSKAAQAITEAARHGRQPSITMASSQNALEVKITEAGQKPLDVMLAITESDLSTQVGRGENHGRLLRHTAVVRELRKIGTTSGGEFSGNWPLQLNPEWRRQNLRAVVFLQDPNTLAIAGAVQVGVK